jgi:hypothetical protein
MDSTHTLPAEFVGRECEQSCAHRYTRTKPILNWHILSRVLDPLALPAHCALQHGVGNNNNGLHLFPLDTALSHFLQPKQASASSALQANGGPVKSGSP